MMHTACDLICIFAFILYIMNVEFANLQLNLISSFKVIDK